jgi:hypothetical protein
MKVKFYEKLSASQNIYHIRFDLYIMLYIMRLTLILSNSAFLMNTFESWNKFLN